jgi:hypothetical protein
LTCDLASRTSDESTTFTKAGTSKAASPVRVLVIVTTKKDGDP